MPDETVQKSPSGEQPIEAEMWDRYLEQQRRLSCPGYGEGQ